VDGKGAHGGYCGPAIKPIALRMLGEIARDPECSGISLSGIGGIASWRDAAEFMALGAGNVQVCTAAMVYGFKVVEDMIDGLNHWMDEKAYRSLAQFVGKAVPNFVDWEHLNLNYTVKAYIDQDLCIQCGRCYIACEDTSHQSISNQKNGQRHFEVIDEECVGCNLCVNVCPVEHCITLKEVPVGTIDPRTGHAVQAYGSWTTHPNNPQASEGKSKEGE
jgi:dihydropyrimidine dehydrogenase (NAD+) subunit PreA